jgi:hypothetical protein
MMREAVSARRKSLLTRGAANGKVEGGGASVDVCVFRFTSVLVDFSEERKNESSVA